MHSSVNYFFTHCCTYASLAAFKQQHRVVLDDPLSSIVTCYIVGLHPHDDPYIDLLTNGIELLLDGILYLAAVVVGISGTTVLYFSIGSLSCYVFAYIFRYRE